jgi:Aspartyl protease
MPALSGRFDPGIGPLINIGVLPPGLLTPATAQTTPITTFPALLDTGASMTCISPHVAQTVGLRLMGLRSMVSATQTLSVPVYLVDLVLPFGAAGFILSGAQVVEFSPTAGSAFQMLVGRDIICRGILTLSFDGHFAFAI